MAASAQPLAAPLPSRRDIDLMTIREIVEELRRTPNPDTGAKSHSLSEIARIAGASPGWTQTVLARPAQSTSDRNSKFLSPLRRYMRKLMEEKGDAIRLMRDPVPGVDIPKRRPKPEVEKPKINPQLEQFMLAFDAQRVRLLDDAVNIEELVKTAPGCFRPAIIAARDTLFGLCESLASPTPMTEITTNASA